MKFKIFAFIVIFVSGLPNAMAQYKIAVISDDDSVNISPKIIMQIASIKPFNHLVSSGQLQFINVQSSAEKLGCGYNSETNKAPECDLSYVSSLALSVNADRVLVISSKVRSGAAVGVMATLGVKDLMEDKSEQRLKEISRIGAHELLHLWDFDDEYKLPGSIAVKNCLVIEPTPNIIALDDQSPYSSDAQAKIIHGGDIPWFGQIKSSTKITNESNLGTPLSKSRNVIGLFPAKTCNSIIPPIPTWKPGHATTIMEDPDAPIPPIYFPAIYAALDAEMPKKKRHPRAYRVRSRAGKKEN